MEALTFASIIGVGGVFTVIRYMQKEMKNTYSAARRERVRALGL